MHFGVVQGFDFSFFCFLVLRCVLWCVVLVVFGFWFFVCVLGVFGKVFSFFSSRLPGALCLLQENQVLVSY